MIYAISGCIVVSWDGRQGQYQRRCNYCGDVIIHTRHGFSLSGTSTLSSGSHSCLKCGKSSDVKIGKSI
jgi:hypothetical protein